MPSFLNLTRILIIVNLAVYLVELAAPDFMIETFALWPLDRAPPEGAPFQFWQLISYGFLHDPSS
jgi:membrane associated rhomboid family serine protease